MLDLLRLTTKTMLMYPENFEWSIQGLGMLRTYMDETQETRLHVWDPESREEDVSPIHDHPWDFKSFVIAGEIRNVRYQRAADGEGEPHREIEIICGPGGCALGKPVESALIELPSEYYGPGGGYRQRAEELHDSDPAQGAVTVIKRYFREGASRDLAHVLWKEGDWVSAEPRPATPQEVTRITRLALERWF